MRTRPHVLAVAGVRLDDGTERRYSFALTGRPLRIAAAGDGAWGALVAAMAEGRTIAGSAARRGSRRGTDGRARVPAGERDGRRCLGARGARARRGPVEHVRRPRRGRPAQGVPAAPAGAEPGAGARRVPQRGGRVRGGARRWPGSRSWCRRGTGRRPSPSPRRSSHDGADAYESIAEALTAWILAPGEVSVEFATEVAADLGTLTAGLHGALAAARGVPDLEPRDASRAELKAWSRAARRGPGRARWRS